MQKTYKKFMAETASDEREIIREGLVKDLERSFKSGSAWKNHGEPGGTDSIHIKN
jgi:hypothetical protein